MSSSLSGHKRRQAEVDVSCCRAVCLEVLVDPVTLPCGHCLDQRCLQKVVVPASGGTGQRACPTCRKALPAELPAINDQMRDLVQWRYQEQVRGTPNVPFRRALCLVMRCMGIRRWIVVTRR